MKIETIKKSHKKEIAIGVSIFIVIAIVLIVKGTFAKYELIKSIKIAEGTINYKVPDFKIMAMYKNDGNSYTEIETMPTSGYVINTEKSYCTLDNINKIYNKMYTDEDGNHVITNLSKSSKCYLYFDDYKKVNTPLGEITVKLATPDFSKTSCTSGCGESTVGIYEAKDDDGWSYYYRGDVENNYLKFAGFWWRIIRINGDGSIRLIYNGTTSTQTSETTLIGYSRFNDTLNRDEYLGFKYTLNERHGLETKSTILEKIESWYKSNLISYVSKLDINAGFCGDRTSGGYGSGVGDSETKYGTAERLIDNKSPNLKCLDKLDLYTLNNAVKGNKSLDYPIGLITADEVALAGGVFYEPNTSFYLYNNEMYFTITPISSYYNNGFYIAFSTVDSNYSLIGNTAGAGGQSKYGVRPVINLRSDVKITGTGIISDPYIVS